MKFGLDDVVVVVSLMGQLALAGVICGMYLIDTRLITARNSANSNRCNQSRAQKFRSRLSCRIFTSNKSKSHNHGAQIPCGSSLPLCGHR